MLYSGNYSVDIQRSFLLAIARTMRLAVNFQINGPEDTKKVLKDIRDI